MTMDAATRGGSERRRPTWEKDSEDKSLISTKGTRTYIVADGQRHDEVRDAIEVNDIRRREERRRGERDAAVSCRLLKISPLLYTFRARLRKAARPSPLQRPMHPIGAAERSYVPSFTRLFFFAAEY